MADKTLNQVFGEIADAIREKNGSKSAIKPINMADEISGIQWHTLKEDQLVEHVALWKDGDHLDYLPGDRYYMGAGSYAAIPLELTDGSAYVYSEYGAEFSRVQGLSSDTPTGVYYYDNASAQFTNCNLETYNIYLYTGTFERCYVDDGGAYIYDGASHVFRPIEATKEIVENGEYDVKNYATVNVTVPGSALVAGLWYSDGQNAPSSVSLENHEYYYYNGGSKFTEAFDQEGVYYYSPNAGLKFLIEYDTSGVYYLGASNVSYKFNLSSGSAYVYNSDVNPALTPVTGTLELKADSISSDRLHVNQLIDVTQYKYFKVIADGKWFTIDNDNSLAEKSFDENEIGYFDHDRVWRPYSLDYGHAYLYDGGSILRDCYLSSGSTYIYTEYGFEPVSGEGQRLYYYGAYGMAQKSISGNNFLCFKATGDVDATVCDDEDGMEVVGGSAIIETSKGTYKVKRIS